MSEVSALSGGGGSVGEGPTGRGSQSKVHRAGPDTTVIPKFDSSSALLLRFSGSSMRSLCFWVPFYY